MNPIRIFTVCLVSHKKFKAAAVYHDETLVVTQVLPISGLFNSWKEPLIKEIQEKVKAGFIVLIEEKTDFIARYATQYQLEDMNDDNDGMRRSNYFDALDWYFALADTNNLIIHQDYQQFLISASTEGGKVEKKQDDKGRSLYNVNWQQFHGGYRAVLLCVVAALYEPLSERFLEDMFQIDEESRKIQHPALRFRKMIFDNSVEQGKQLEKIKEEMP